MNNERWNFHISHVYSIWQDLSHHTLIFDLVTLTLKFDLLFKNFNIGHNLWTGRDRTFIFHMCILCVKIFHTIDNFWPSDLDLEVWPTSQKTLALVMIYEP